MESGSSMPLAGFVILLLLLWLNGIFYGFSAAVHNLSENEVEKRACRFWFFVYFITFAVIMNVLLVE